MAKTILKLDNIVSGYVDEIDILKGVSLEIKKAEITSIIGPNGAGKSTLFRTVYGTLIPKSGQVFFDGEDITRKKSLDRLKMGLLHLPQGRCNFPTMTVKENLEMGAFTRNDSKISKDIERVLNLFPEIKRYRNKMAGNLSGGEQKMMEMARALLLNPKLIMLDEPSLGLAPQMITRVFEKILQVNKMGATIMIIEQNAKKALSVSDHAFVLVMGKKRYEGTGNEMASNEEVKRAFLGCK